MTWSLFSCEETDPDTISVADTSIAFTFINQRELSLVLGELATKDLEIKSTNASIAAIGLRLSLLSYRAAQLQIEINAGNTSLQDELDSVLAIMKTDSLERTFYTQQLGLLAAQISSLNKKKTIIESGKVKIDSVLILFGTTNLSFSDSLTSYRFPLNIASEISGYQINLDTIYQLDLLHDNEIVIDARRRARISHENFRTLSTTFDSVKFNCNPCNAGNTVVICYF